MGPYKLMSKFKAKTQAQPREEATYGYSSALVM